MPSPNALNPFHCQKINCTVCRVFDCQRAIANAFQTVKAMLLIAALLLGSAVSAKTPFSTSPHLEKRGRAVQLIVDDAPYLILSGELANTASSSPEYMKTVWPRLVRMNLNTVLAAVA
ncbi:MAG TPA: hypothetical protein VGB38_04490, partial [bacterium]